MELKEPAVIGSLACKVVDITPMSEEALSNSQNMYDDFNKTFLFEYQVAGQLATQSLPITEKQAEKLSVLKDKAYMFKVVKLVKGETSYEGDDGNIIPHKGSTVKIDPFKNALIQEKRFVDEDLVKTELRRQKEIVMEDTLILQL